MTGLGYTDLGYVDNLDIAFPPPTYTVYLQRRQKFVEEGQWVPPQVMYLKKKKLKEKRDRTVQRRNACLVALLFLVGIAYVKT